MNINLSENDEAFLELSFDSVFQQAYSFMTNHIVKHNNLTFWFVPISNPPEVPRYYVVRYNGIDGVFLASYYIETPKFVESYVITNYVDLLTPSGFWGATPCKDEDIPEMDYPRIVLKEGSFVFLPKWRREE